MTHSRALIAPVRGKSETKTDRTKFPIVEDNIVPCPAKPLPSVWYILFILLQILHSTMRFVDDDVGTCCKYGGQTASEFC